MAEVIKGTVNRYYLTVKGSIPLNIQPIIAAANAGDMWINTVTMMFAGEKRRTARP